MSCSKWKIASYKFYALDINNSRVDINKIIQITFDEISKEVVDKYGSAYKKEFLINEDRTNRVMLNIFLLKGFGFFGNFASYYHLTWLDNDLINGIIEWPGKHRAWAIERIT